MKKILWLLILSLVAAFCAVGFTACGDGKTGAQGEKGQDGITPTIEINADGFWVINGEKTEYKAIGNDGKDGAGIKSAVINENGELVLMLTDNTVINAGKIGGGEHKHNYTETRVDATCTTNGYTLYQCVCGNEYKGDIIAALGHNYEWTVTKEPTETEDGIETGVCTRCNHTLTRNIPALSHTHNYTETVVEPTCREGGYVIYKCSCGSEYTGSYIPPINHDYNTVVTEPTCTEMGYTTYTCSMCGYTYTGNHVGALGHEYGEWNVIKEPTCHETGSEIGYCIHDNAHTETRIIQAKHNSLEVGDACELCGYSVLQKDGDSVLMTDGNDYLSAEFYGTVVGGGYYGGPIFGYPIQEYITNLYFSDSVTSIGYQAFSDCYNLTSITFGENSKLESIGSQAFYCCYSLTSITIPDSVASIGYQAFDSCSSLTSITIGNSVASIGYNVFDGCESLTKVNFTGTIDEWCEIWFGNYYSNPLCYAKNLYIDNELVTTANITTATTINTYAFSGCSSLTSITIPDSVTIIGNGAFDDCSNLTDINFNGTKMQWNVISKGDNWNGFIPATVVHCTNGDVEI